MDRSELIYQLLNIQLAYRELGNLLPDETAYQLITYVNQNLNQVIPKTLAALE